MFKSAITKDGNKSKDASWEFLGKYKFCVKLLINPLLGTYSLIYLLSNLYLNLQMRLLGHPDRVSLLFL